MEVDPYQSSQVTLLDLPAEDVLFAEIFSHLSLKDALSIGCCSKSFQSLVAFYFTCCKDYNFENYKNSGEDLFKRLFTNKERVRNLSLSGCKHWVTNELLLSTLFENNNSTLTKLDLAECSILSDGILHHLSHHCPNLIEVNLSGLVRISNAAFSNFVTKCNKIERLFLADCWSLDDSCIVSISKNLHALKELDISRLHQLGDVGLNALKDCSNLEVLVLRHIGRVTDKSIQKLLEFCHNLKEIDAVGCSKITVLTLIRLQMKNIKSDLVRSVTPAITPHSEAACSSVGLSHSKPQIERYNEHINRRFTSSLRENEQSSNLVFTPNGSPELSCSLRGESLVDQPSTPTLEPQSDTSAGEIPKVWPTNRSRESVNPLAGLNLQI